MTDSKQSIWLDGKLVPWENAQVHVLTHSLHYGVATFEGIRAYAQPNGSVGIFCLEEHIDRLFASSHIALLDIPYTKAQIMDACKEVVRVNKLKNGCYIRPLVFMGDGALGLGTSTNPIRVAIAAWEWGAYLGEDGVKNGIRTKISPYRRNRLDAAFSKGKICGQYVTSVLAKRDAIMSGFDEALLLDQEGGVCEGTGENVFVVLNNQVRTPALGDAILGGITRQVALNFLHDMQVPVSTGRISCDEMYIAQEVFLTGTAAEVTPVREVDHRKIGEGKPGPITRSLQERFHALVSGNSPGSRKVLTLVEM